MATSCVILTSGEFQAMRQLRIPAGSTMRFLHCVLIALAALSSTAHAQTRIDAISTQFRWLGPNDKIVVERYDDPKVANVSCYLSRAETGGMKGGLGFAEDPSRFSIACRAVGPIDVPAGLREVRGDRIRLRIAVLQDLPNPSRRRCGEERAGLHRREHQADQRLAVQQHQRGAGGSAGRPGVVGRCERVQAAAARRASSPPRNCAIAPGPERAVPARPARASASGL